MYWMNILLNCWFGLISSTQFLSRKGLTIYSMANAFTAVSYFVLLLILGDKYEKFWFSYAAFMYLPYLVASGMVLLISLYGAIRNGGKGGISIPSVCLACGDVLQA